MKPRHVLVSALAMALALGGCAETPRGAERLHDAASTYGACGPDDSGTEFVPPAVWLGYAQDWREVLNDTSVDTAKYAPDAGSTITVRLTVRGYDAPSGAFVGTGAEEKIAVHSSMLPGIDWALANGGRAFLAITTEGVNGPMVAYTLVQTSDGDYFFAGECQTRGLTAPLQELLGKSYEETIASIVGQTDPTLIIERLQAAAGDERSALSD